MICKLNHAVKAKRNLSNITLCERNASAPHAADVGSCSETPLQMMGMEWPRAVNSPSVWLVPTGDHTAHSRLEPHPIKLPAISRELFTKGSGVGYPGGAGYALGRSHPSQVLQKFRKVWLFL